MVGSPLAPARDALSIPTDMASRLLPALLALPAFALGACRTASEIPAPEPSSPAYEAGRVYRSPGGYVEYLAGDAPVIYTAPHGGTEAPASIPHRTDARCGEAVVVGADLNTADLARRMHQAHHARTGRWPHVIVNLLHRRKLDANRPMSVAACGSPEAEAAFREFLGYVEAARDAALRVHGRAWAVDLHGHAHAKARLELGYLLSASQLRLSDAALDASPALEDSASIATLAREAPASLSALLRGPGAVGTLYALEGFAAVPSAQDPAPLAGDPYFDGGYNTARHGCGAVSPALGGLASRRACGLQIEAPFAGVRDTDANRQRFAEATARVMERFLREQWGLAGSR